MIGALITHKTVRHVRQPNGGKVKGNKRPLLLSRPERAWCSYCDMPAEGWDHVEPWSQSRDNSADNLVPACQQCNEDKGDLPLIVFLALTVPERAA